MKALSKLKIQTTVLVLFPYHLNCVMYLRLLVRTSESGVYTKACLVFANIEHVFKILNSVTHCNTVLNIVAQCYRN